MEWVRTMQRHRTRRFNEFVEMQGCESEILWVERKRVAWNEYDQKECGCGYERWEQQSSFWLGSDGDCSGNEIIVKECD